MIPTLQRLGLALARRWWAVAVPHRLRAAGVELGGRLVAWGWPVVSRAEGSRLVLGDAVVLGSRPAQSALGVAGPVVLRTLRPGALLEIGADTGLSGVAICAAVSVRIGRQCLLGAGVKVFDTDFHPLAPEGRRHADDWSRIACAPVEIGDQVFIGTGAIVCKGVRIGDGAVIGAGAVVTRDVPARHVAAGNPARVLRPLPPADAPDAPALPSPDSLP